MVKNKLMKYSIQYNITCAVVSVRRNISMRITKSIIYSFIKNEFIMRINYYAHFQLLVAFKRIWYSFINRCSMVIQDM